MIAKKKSIINIKSTKLFFSNLEKSTFEKSGMFKIIFTENHMLRIRKRYLFCPKRFRQNMYKKSELNSLYFLTFNQVQIDKFFPTNMLYSVYEIIKSCLFYFSYRLFLDISVHYFRSWCNSLYIQDLGMTRKVKET